MANIFIDGTLTTGSNDGTTFDNAYQTAAGLNRTFAGENYVWIRRASDLVLAANITIASASANAGVNTKVSLWPRPSRSLTGTWVQGERVISGVSGLIPKLTSHAARYIKNDTDGRYYLITAIAVKIVFSAITQAFARYETITASGGAIGKIMRWDNATNTAWVVVKSGTFASAETVTGDGKVQEAVTKTAGAGTISTITAADGFVILQDYVGTSESSGNSTIKADKLYDIAQSIDDSAWTIKKTVWDADDDDMPIINGGSTSYRSYVSGYYTRLIGLNFYGGSGSLSAGILGLGGALSACLEGCLLQGVLNNPLVYAIDAAGYHFVDTIFIGTGLISNTADRAMKSQSPGCLLKNCAIYNFGTYGVELLLGGLVENCNFGVELDNGNYDLQNQSGYVKGFDVQCGGKNGSLRTGTYDESKIWTGIHNWQRVLGQNIRKISGGKVNFISSGSEPSTPPSGASTIMRLFRDGSPSQIDYLAAVVSEIPLYLTAGAKTLKVYIQNYGCGNINTSDVDNSATIFFEVVASEQRVSDSLYYVTPSSDGLGYKKSASSSNPIANRSSALDWSAYLTATISLPVAEMVLVRIKTRLSHATGYIYIDPVVEVS